jgi:hypothetical protein
LAEAVPAMDLDDVEAITNFLTKNVYPSNFGINDKRSLRQKSKSFICCAGKFNHNFVLTYLSFLVDFASQLFGCLYAKICIKQINIM